MVSKPAVLRPRPSVVTNDADAEKLLARQSKFTANVEEIPGLRLVIHPTGRKAWESNIKHPITQKLISKTHGSFPSVKLNQAIKLHQQFYSQIRAGDDPKLTATQQKRRHQAHAILRTPIVKLGELRLEKKLELNEINDAYNDRLALKKIETIIGNTSFYEFDEACCDKLSKAYPDAKDGWTVRDKVKKQITKLYNSLASDVRGELRLDIPHLLRQKMGIIHQRDRSELHLPSNSLTDFWIRLLTAPVPQIHKDFLVLCLLTGERKQALLSLKLEQIHMRPSEPLILFTEGKRIQNNPDPSPNLIPITPMIGLLLNRLVARAKETNSEYLFAGQKGNRTSHLTDVSKPLLNWLGHFGNDVRVSAHNLRRTLAHEAAVAIGDIPTADAHILHPHRHFTGSRVNYFSTEATDFCKVREPTYEKAHQRIDDLILSNAVVSQTSGFLDEQNDGYDPGDHLAYLGGTADGAVTMFPPVMTQERSNEVLSPLASFCKGTPVYVRQESRPMFLKSLHKGGLEDLIETYEVLDFEKRIQ